LQKNTERLTTAFDVYETLQDVLNSKFEHTERVDEKSRGISLFRPIPDSSFRTSTVKIPYCLYPLTDRS
jgi:hypothetical protein